jgi:hypothetical protein
MLLLTRESYINYRRDDWQNKTIIKILLKDRVDRGSSNWCQEENSLSYLRYLDLRGRNEEN